MDPFPIVEIEIMIRNSSFFLQPSGDANKSTIILVPAVHVGDDQLLASLIGKLFQVSHFVSLGIFVSFKELALLPSRHTPWTSVTGLRELTYGASPIGPMAPAGQA